MPDYITNRGTNTEGNKWDTRVSDTGGQGYHYSNKDNSYYYKNTDGSTYYNDGNGYTQYTSPSGTTFKSYNSGKK